MLLRQQVYADATQDVQLSPLKAVEVTSAQPSSLAVEREQTNAGRLLALWGCSMSVRW